MKRQIIMMASLLLLTGSVMAQTTPTAPYISIIQNQTIPGQSISSPLTVANEVNSGPLGSQSVPTGLDFGYPFTIYVDVPKGAYTGQSLFLYMQDSQYGSGAFNNWYWQGTPVSVPASILSGPTAVPSNSNVDRYTFTMGQGQYPVLMNCQSYWSQLLDGSVIRPTLNVGWTTNSGSNPTTANWGNYVINSIDIWGYKNRLSLVYPPLTNPDVILEINQYTPINQNLEQMLLAGVSSNSTMNVIMNGVQSSFTLPGGTGIATNAYTWYMDDEFGVSPYTYLVNDPNLWMNNIYQIGYKPWINSTHVDGSLGLNNIQYWSQNSAGLPCYTLIYYVIPSSYVPSGAGFVPTATFDANAQRVIIKINPYISPATGQPTQSTSPFISDAITIASQDYGSAAAGTQWGSALPAGQTNYTFAGNYLPGDGQYSIAQDIVGIIGGSTNTRPIDWYVPAGGANAPAQKYDHTSGNGTGYMYIVNASALGGIFYQNTFNVCPNMSLQFSMWLMNICDGTRQNTSYNSKYRIKPNV
ncbi:MAG: hypothetical protein LBN18_06980, partial [Dysgonamonadaceae bacterium]|nr:hypothetical protein [Dysgonamonadaceae bacterium]